MPSVNEPHPSYSAKLLDWQLTIDTHAGQRQVKDRRETYLPATAGMTIDGMGTGQPGLAAYDAYLKRALFPPFVKEAVDNLVGLMHREPASIELPERLEPMLENATAAGESLQTLLRRINEAQLMPGRFGLLVEVPTGEGVADAMPFIATYGALAVVNWDDGRREQGRQALELVVLCESEHERTSDFSWEFVEKHRVLARSGLTAQIGSTDQASAAKGTYVVAVLRETADVSEADFMAPSVGGRTLDRIPFVFVNPQDLLPTPDDPPLLGLSDLSLTVYRADADYRQSLFEQGQETLVTIGAQETEGDGEPERVGAGSRIDLPEGGDAKYVGVSAAGLSEMRNSLENDKKQANEMGSRLLSSTGGTAESGEALRVRVAAKTPTLTSVALAGAEALEQSLRIAAEWVGADPDKVMVEPNLDFAADELAGKDLVDLMAAKTLGAPLSLRSVHRLMRRKDVTDLDFEEELAEIEQEEPLIEPEPEPVEEDEPDPDEEDEEDLEE